MKIPFITNWLRLRAERERIRLHHAGYNLAAGLCLKGFDQEEITAMQDMERNAFDDGMDEAMRDFSTLLAGIRKPN